MIRRDFLRSLIVAPAAGLVQVPLVWTPEAFAQQAGGMALPEPFKPARGGQPSGRRGERDPPGQGGLGARFERRHLGRRDGALVG